MMHSGLIEAISARNVDDVTVGIGGDPGQVASVVVAEFTRTTGVNAVPTFRPMFAVLGTLGSN